MNFKYNEIVKGGFRMRLCEKIVELRKMKSMSQETLAERLNVSRQAISRWEMGTAMPDANNILQLSKLFGVTTDYLLNDDFNSDEDLPKINEVKNRNFGQIMVYLVTIEVMVLIIQFMATIILQNVIFAFLSFIPFVAAIGGFEYAFRKGNINNEIMIFRKNFYKISAWLGLYFPIRFIIRMAANLYPRPYNSLTLECIILAVYMAVAFCTSLTIEQKYISWKNNQ